MATSSFLRRLQNDPIVAALTALVYERGATEPYSRDLWLDWRYRALREDAYAIGLRRCPVPGCLEVWLADRDAPRLSCAFHATLPIGGPAFVPGAGQERASA